MYIKVKAPQSSIKLLPDWNLAPLFLPPSPPLGPAHTTTLVPYYLYDLHSPTMDKSSPKSSSYLLPQSSTQTNTRLELTDGLAHLSLSQHPARKPLTKEKKKKVPVAESWDDEPEEPSDNEEAASSASTPERIPSPHALGHTRNSSSVSPVASSRSPREIYIGPDTFARDGGPVSTGGGRGDRPMKTDAVARRMISAALGVRTKSTKEQREYDSAVRATEKKKKDEEKEKKKLEEKEKERMKTAIWED